MEVGRRALETIRAAQAGWTPERVQAGQRAAVYAVATADRLSREDLVQLRIAAETEDMSDEVVRLARWFDGATYPPSDKTLTVDEALAQLDEQSFSEEIVAAFREVQPLIQPVGL